MPIDFEGEPVKAGHFDVLIIGAGISGIGMAHHIQDQMPLMTFALIDSKDSFGGTWRTHIYPGVRSDSDLYTFGYRFKPWSGKPIATADRILKYLQEVIEEDGLEDKIRYSQKVIKASWSSRLKLWRIITCHTKTGKLQEYTARYLSMCQGYYDHSKGYTPEFEGMPDYKGQIVHPQDWPENLDYAGKRMIVIGSGATAATVIPELAETASHVTMLQRSPTYFWADENRNRLADFLRMIMLPEKLVHKIIRWQILLRDKIIHGYAKSRPDVVKKNLLSAVRANLPEGFDVDKHFTPAYRPWQQRLAFIPEGNLFKGIRDGKVSVVTDTISKFTPEGILTGDGEHLKADIIVTATGFNLSVMGGIPFDIDDQPVDFSQRLTYRGVLMSDLPNFWYIFGYLRTSWTMRVDLVSDFVLRLLKHMRSRKVDVFTPILRPEDQNMATGPWIPESDFNPGYMKRSIGQMPLQGDQDPWMFTTDYYQERDILPKAKFDDGALRFEKAENAHVSDSVVQGSATGQQ